MVLNIEMERNEQGDFITDATLSTEIETKKKTIWLQVTTGRWNI